MRAIAFNHLLMYTQPSTTVVNVVLGQSKLTPSLASHSSDETERFIPQRCSCRYMRPEKNLTSLDSTRYSLRPFQSNLARARLPH